MYTYQKANLIASEHLSIMISINYSEIKAATDAAERLRGQSVLQIFIKCQEVLDFLYSAKIRQKSVCNLEISDFTQTAIEDAHK